MEFVVPQLTDFWSVRRQNREQNQENMIKGIKFKGGVMIKGLKSGS